MIIAKSLITWSTLSLSLPPLRNTENRQGFAASRPHAKKRLFWVESRLARPGTSQTGFFFLLCCLMYFPPLPEIFCAASLFCVCEQKKKPRRPFWGAKWQLPLRVTSQGKWTRRGENLIGDGGERRRTTLEARIPGIANAVSPYWSISIGADSAEGREREIQFAAACVCVPLAYTDDRLSRRWHWQKKKKETQSERQRCHSISVWEGRPRHESGMRKAVTAYSLRRRRLCDAFGFFGTTTTSGPWCRNKLNDFWRWWILFANVA